MIRTENFHVWCQVVAFSLRENSMKFQYFTSLHSRTLPATMHGGQCLFTGTSINVFVASLYQSSSSFTPDCIMVTVCRQVNLSAHECCCTKGKRISIAFHIHGSHHLIRKEPTKHQQHIMHSNRCVSSVITYSLETTIGKVAFSISHYKIC